jgi:hypothetical protein
MALCVLSNTHLDTCTHTPLSLLVYSCTHQLCHYSQDVSLYTGVCLEHGILVCWGSERVFPPQWQALGDDTIGIGSDTDSAGSIMKVVDDFVGYSDPRNCCGIVCSYSLNA